MDKIRPTQRRLPAALVAVVLAGLMLAGCSGSGNDSGAATSEAQPASVADAPEAVPGATEGASQDAAQSDTGKRAPTEQSGGKTGAVTSLGDPERALVYTGTLSVTAKNVSDAAGRAVQTTLASGGYVSGDERNVSGDRLTVTLTLRVPSAKFATTVDSLAALGTERARRLGTEDLQTATIDLDARIATQRASVNRTRALLERANSISEITTIERELTTRETELATSEASRRTVDDQVAYSTITLTLTEPSAPPESEPKQERGLLVGLRNGWEAFVATVSVALTILGWLAPFLVTLAVLGGPIWWAVRRSRRRTRTPAPPTPDVAPAPEAEAPEAGELAAPKA